MAPRSIALIFGVPLVLCGLLSGTTLAAPVVEASRISGDDRYETAVQVALRTFPDGADQALLATGQNFPDALMASSIAGLRPMPILLTGPETLHDATAGAIRELGVQRVLILGDTTVVGRQVEEQLAEMGADTVRFGGATRYDTQESAYSSGDHGFAMDGPGDPPGMVDGQSTALLVSGEDFPDALAAGPVAYAERLPLLLTPRDLLAPQTRRLVSALRFSRSSS